MPKKKKNQSSHTSIAKTPPLKKGSRNAHGIENHLNLQPAQQHSTIIVRLPRFESVLKKTNRPITQENDHLIFIHANDARGFSVGEGEEVLILQVDLPTQTLSPQSMKVLWKSNNEAQSKEPLFASVCRLAISQDQINSRSPRNGSAKKNKSLREGEGYILPSALAQRIINDPLLSAEDPHTLQSSQYPGQSTMMSTPLAESSSLEPQFTFETFASSPANSKQIIPSKVSTPQTTQRRTHKIIALLSLEKNKEAFEVLATDAECLTLSLIDATSSLFSKDVLKRSEHILGHVVKALCHGVYISSGETITISFQGKRLSFMVERVEWDDDLRSQHFGVKALQKLNRKCDDDNGGENIQGILANQILEMVKSPVLFRITRETRIGFALQHDGRGGTVAGDDQIDVAGVTDQDRINKSPRRIVAGLNPILKQIHSLLIPMLLHVDRFRCGGAIGLPKGLLLHGTSGCGKSLIAQQVALDVNHHILRKDRSVDVVRVNCAGIQSSTSIMGNAEKKLTNIFQLAEKRAVIDGVSTLLIMDDIHLICPRRGAAGGGSGVERVASTLLALLDGIDKGENDMKNCGNIAILAITTNPSLLDPALRRAGRLDTEVEIPSPDEETKIEIFSQHLERLKAGNVKVPSSTKLDLKVLSTLAKGFTGADCALSVKEATRCAILRHMKKGRVSSAVDITSSDIEQAIRRTKPSSIKSITVEIPQVPWSSIGGMDCVKNSLKEAIELPLTHSYLFTALCIPPPRGVLLYGPPGCSKTLMARALATEGCMNFLTVKGPELLSKWLGESERALADLFRRARLASPCVIFFDEIDAIASKRGSGESSGGERMLSQLLTELDGVTTSKGSEKTRIIVVGATNRPDLLDAALMRPGRIDRMIYVGIPDKETREAIFRLQLKGKSCCPDIDLLKLAAGSEGFSGAEIVSLCRESMLYAIEENDKFTQKLPKLQMKHLLKAMHQTKRQITPEMLEYYKSFGKSKIAL